MVSEVKSECPVCGHSAVLLVDQSSHVRIINCPDRYCANNKDPQPED